jgi:hypothetical protein
VLDAEHGAVYIDVDESINRVKVGVSDAATAGRVVAALGLFSFHCGKNARLHIT